MNDQRCWNCGSNRGTVRSVVTGVVYCATCGAAVVGRGAVMDRDVRDQEPAAGPGGRDGDTGAR